MRIEIKYDGKYPNLCSGKLIVNIDGKEYGDKEDIFQLVSGGYCRYNKSTSTNSKGQGEWAIDIYPSDFPEDMKHIVLGEVNRLIPHGCCGGCS